MIHARSRGLPEKPAATVGRVVILTKSLMTGFRFSIGLSFCLRCLTDAFRNLHWPLSLDSAYELLGGPGRPLWRREKRSRSLSPSRLWH